MTGEPMMSAELVFDIIPEYTARSNMLADAITKAAREKIAKIARARVAVDTGATRDSIEVTDDGVEAGEAALFLEYGTVHMAAEPFLGVSAEAVKESFAAELRAALDGL